MCKVVHINRSLIITHSSKDENYFVDLSDQALVGGNKAREHVEQRGFARARAAGDQHVGAVKHAGL